MFSFFLNFFFSSMLRTRWAFIRSTRVVTSIAFWSGLLLTASDWWYHNTGTCDDALERAKALEKGRRDKKMQLKHHHKQNVTRTILHKNNIVILWYSIINKSISGGKEVSTQDYTCNSVYDIMYEYMCMHLIPVLRNTLLEWYLSSWS